ncbi:MAG TPA: hypothetical protein EYN79_03145 [Planctomycetes bacterium]|nr:hypothetical protein [Planctomycetota bacterium]HIN80656.1 hypothetical protein [Planctomycetota bacterium]
MPYSPGPLLILIAALSSPAGEPITVDELSLLEPSSQVVEILATYKGRVGQTLLVEGLEEPLRLAPICRLPRRGKEEAPLLELKVLVCGPGRNGIEWTVISAGRIDAPSAAVEKQIERAIDARGSRRAQVCRWLLRLDFLDDARSARLWADLAPSPRSHEDALEWLRAGREKLGNSPDFLRYVGEIHQAHIDKPGIERRLRQMELVNDGERWHDSEGFLRRLGVIERDGTLVTLERVRLEDAVTTWVDGGGNRETLRQMIKPHIDRLISEGTVAAGLKREEVVAAWGTPEQVTWLRRGNSLFEGWYWSRREVHLVDGTVFSSND